MKTKTLLMLVPAALGLALVGAYATLTQTGGDTGGPVPKSAVITPTGETESAGRVDLKSLAGNLEFLGDKRELAGHPVLIEFWATWCPPCRASIAHLNELDNKYHNRGLEIVGIANEEKAMVERFRARTPMNYAVALDRNQALATQFQVQSIPQAWLFDKDGRVVWSGHPMELDDQTITSVLPNRPAS